MRCGGVGVKGGWRHRGLRDLVCGIGEGGGVGD